MPCCFVIIVLHIYLKIIRHVHRSYIFVLWYTRNILFLFINYNIKMVLFFEDMNKENKHRCFIPVVIWCNEYVQYICSTSLLLYCTEQ